MTEFSLPLPPGVFLTWSECRQEHPFLRQPNLKEGLKQPKYGVVYVLFPRIAFLPITHSPLRKVEAERDDNKRGAQRTVSWGIWAPKLHDYAVLHRYGLGTVRTAVI
jgi:hypothetical protein